MHQFFVDQLVPESVSQLEVEFVDGLTATLTNEDIAGFLSSHGITTFSITIIISRWMNAAGFGYKKVRRVPLWIGTIRDMKQ